MNHLKSFKDSHSTIEEISEKDFDYNIEESTPSILTESESTSVTEIFNKYDQGGYIRYFLIPNEVDTQEDGYENSNNMDIQCVCGRYIIAQIDLYKMKPKHVDVYLIRFSGSYHPSGNDMCFMSLDFENILSCLDKELYKSKKYWNK